MVQHSTPGTATAANAVNNVNASAPNQPFASQLNQVANAAFRKAPTMPSNALTSASIDSSQLQGMTSANGQAYGYAGPTVSTSPLLPGYQNRYPLTLQNMKPGQPGLQNAAATVGHGAGGTIMVAGQKAGMQPGIQPGAANLIGKHP